MINYDSSWSYIEYNRNYGYVSTQYLTQNSNTGSSNTTSTNGQKVANEAKKYIGWTTLPNGNDGYYNLNSRNFLYLQK